MTAISAYAPDGVPEVGAGDDLAALLLAACELADGDVVVVTSKVVSKAEGRARTGSREEALPGETARVVARRGPLAIVRTHHGLTLAAAGIDASNVAAGTVLLLPEDPDGTARRIRETLLERTGRNVAVVVSDTAGRAWREGQTDVAIGCAGLPPLVSYAGARDAHGNELAVTAPAVADEVAGLAELASGKLGGRPFVRVRGLADRVLPPGEHGPGAAALVRAEGGDLFGWGAREAVLRAVRADPADRPPFGSAVAVDELLGVCREAGLAVVRDGDGVRTADESARTLWALDVLAFAHGWKRDDGVDLRWRPAAT